MTDIKKFDSYNKLSFEDLIWITDHVFGNLFVCDGDGKILFCNQNAAGAFGLTKEKTLTMNTRDIVGSGIINRSTTIEALESKETVIGSFTSQIGLEFFAISTPLLDDNGEVSLVMTYSQEKSLMTTFNEIIEKEIAAKEKYQSAYSYLIKAKNASIIVNNKKMIEQYVLAEKIAKTDSTVLILGETGSGKDVMANFIHVNSFRANEPFIPVNCSAIPFDLIESEFFGYEKGAFTGADRGGKLGLFELANKGTLFLDEIGDLPLPMQSKLLRVLETGEFMRVGGTKAVKSDIRLVTATNRDLPRMIAEQTFREDLYYRLNILPISLPPLRERKDDIEPLANHFLTALNKKHSLNRRFSKALLQQFQAYDWPGNIRELKNYIERLIITSNDDLLTADRDFLPLSADSCDTPLNPSMTAIAHPDMAGFALSSDITNGMSVMSRYHEMEKQRLLTALIESKGNKTEAAKRLGISTGKLYRLLKRL